MRYTNRGGKINYTRKKITDQLKLESRILYAQRVIIIIIIVHSVDAAGNDLGIRCLLVAVVDDIDTLAAGPLCVHMELLALKCLQRLIQIEAIATIAFAAEAVPHVLQPVGRSVRLLLGGEIAEIVDTLAASIVLDTLGSGHHISVAVQRVAAIRRGGG